MEKQLGQRGPFKPTELQPKLCLAVGVYVYMGLWVVDECIVCVYVCVIFLTKLAFIVRTSHESPPSTL